MTERARRGLPLCTVPQILLVYAIQVHWRCDVRFLVIAGGCRGLRLRAVLQSLPLHAIQMKSGCGPQQRVFVT